VHFDEISVKISVLGVLYSYHCTDGGQIWHGGGTLPNFTPSVQRVAPVGWKTSKSASE